MKGSYIIVGENIHCTRIRMTSGKFVETMKDGRSALVFKDGKEPRYMPIPQTFIESEDWKNGKIRHVAAAIYQGLYGNDAEREAGKAYIAAMAKEQEAKGAWFLDLNVDEFSVDVKEKIKAIEWSAAVIQKAATIPLSIDSSNPEILASGLAACDKTKGKPLVNSVSLERATSIPVAAKAKACVIAGATGETKMPDTVEERIANLERLVRMLTAQGFGLSDIFLDPLVFPVSVNSKNGIMVIESVKALRAKYGKEIHFAPGLSNISFGLPKRNIVNQVFAYLCLKEGCDGGIVDPLQINDDVLAHLDTTSETYRLTEELLLGNDEYGMNFIEASREGRI